MAGRYTDWRRIRGDFDRPEVIDVGRKLLGYLAEQRRLSGVKSCSAERTLPDGTVVRARFVYDHPEIEVSTAESTRQQSVATGAGFVTWPTDDAGADALETARIVLAGSKYEGIREGRYSVVFPDGLNRAGNVDWKGKGWAVSWYGPRTRYFETAPVLKPFVFSKGLPIADATELVDIDAVVLGACVTTAFGAGAWLVVVSEEFTFGRWEDVWTARLRHPDTGEPSKATDTKFEVDPDSFVYLDSRFNNTDTTTFRHPWFFNPDGTEGRMITETDLGLTERIIRLVEDAEADCGFAVERDVALHGPVAESTTEGYTVASYGAYVGRFSGQRRQEFDLSSVAPTGPSPPGPDTDLVPISGAFTVETTEGSYIIGDSYGLTDYTYANDTTCAEVWQIAAVDYRADGEVVYGYARHAAYHTSGSGSFAPSMPLPEIATTYDDNSWSGGYRSLHPAGEANPGEWAASINYTVYNHTTTGAAFAFEAQQADTEDSILGGLKVGALEVSALRTSTLIQTGTYAGELAPFVHSGTAASYGGDDGDYVVDPNDVQFPAAQPRLGAFWIGSPTSLQASNTRVENKTAEKLYLVHMDLRHDALFVAIERAVDTETRVTTATWTDLSFPMVGPMETVTDTTHLKSFRVLGYVHGAEPPVVDETVVVRDTSDHGVVSGSVPSSGPFTSVSGDHPWRVDTDGLLQWGNLAPAMNLPFLAEWIPVVNDNTIPADPAWGDTVPPASYTAELVPIDVNPDKLYQARSEEFPIYQQLTLSWHIELEHNRSGNVGYSFGATDSTSRAQSHWHTDADGVDHVGSWAYYGREWAFSMSLPTQALGDTFSAISLCRIGEIETHVLSDAEQVLVEHMFPIWVLPPSIKRL